MAHLRRPGGAWRSSGHARTDWRGRLDVRSTPGRTRGGGWWLSKLNRPIRSPSTVIESRSSSTFYS